MRDKLIKILQDMGRVAFTNEEKADYLLQHGVMPVVRCKDCRYFEKDKIHKITGVCTRFNTGIFTHRMEPYNFCSYGERKDDK